MESRTGLKKNTWKEHKLGYCLPEDRAFRCFTGISQLQLALSMLTSTNHATGRKGWGRRAFIICHASLISFTQELVRFLPLQEGREPGLRWLFQEHVVRRLLSVLLVASLLLCLCPVPDDAAELISQWSHDSSLPSPLPFLPLLSAPFPFFPSFFAACGRHEA